MTLIQNQRQFSKDVATLINHIYDEGCSVSLGEAWRTKEQAEWNVAHHTGILNSLHCSRLAIDLNIFDTQGQILSKPEQWEKFGCFWENLDPANRWGGRFSNSNKNGYKGPGCDMDHFERQEK